MQGLVRVALQQSGQPLCRCLAAAALGNQRADQRRRGDAHDVAVALREILKDYGGQVAAALVEQSAENALQPRFRVLVSPSLVLAYRGETLEVIPRVRDWSDYARAFQRYLGSPGGAVAQEH